MTRERMSTTLAQLEHKLNVVQLVRDHPWPAIAAAVGAGYLLSGSRADVKAAAATAFATRGASARVGSVLDDVIATLMTGVSAAFATKVNELVDELKVAIGAPAAPGAGRQQNFAGSGRYASGSAAGDGYGASHGGYGASGAGTSEFGGPPTGATGGTGSVGIGGTGQYGDMRAD
jgi:hypothetical protein